MELEADHAGITEVLERSKCTIYIFLCQFSSCFIQCVIVHLEGFLFDNQNLCKTVFFYAIRMYHHIRVIFKHISPQ